MFVHKSITNKTIVGITLAAAVLALNACGKTETGISTAERVKLVEEKQKADPNAHLPVKAADKSKLPATSAKSAPSTGSTALR